MCIRDGDYGVLTELHFHHMEAEGLDLPDEGLNRAVRGAAGTRGGQRALDLSLIHI